MKSPYAIAVCLVAGVLFLALSVSVGSAEEDTPAQRAAAIEAAKPVIAAARKARQGDADTTTALREVRKTLDDYVDDVRKAHWESSKEGRSEALAVVWNELLTVAKYHGVDFKEAYILDSTPAIDGRYRIGLLPGDVWSTSPNTDAKTADQLRQLFTQKRPGGGPLREIKVWVYKWNTVYSGVGGENYKGLAKMMHEYDRDSTAKKGRKSSRSIGTRKINSEFSRAYYYFIEGFDVDEEQNLRRDNYYMKGDSISFNFEVITHIDPAKGDDDVTKWQAGEDDPEIEAVLSSLSSPPEKK